jgi:hypothetical protein
MGGPSRFVLLVNGSNNLKLFVSSFRSERFCLSRAHSSTLSSTVVKSRRILLFENVVVADLALLALASRVSRCEAYFGLSGRAAGVASRA